MRIIGGRDYYDGAGMGTDTSVFFKRRAAEETWDQPHPLTLPKSQWTTHTPACVTYGQAMVGGVVLPFLEWRTPTPSFARYWNAFDVGNGRAPARWDARFVYDAQEAKTLLLDLLGTRAQRLGYNQVLSPLDALDHHFSTTTLQGDALEWALREHIATYVLRRLEQSNTTLALWANTPDLATVQAWQAIDPATAHMRIAGWVGGVLSSSKPMVELTDSDRIRKAGFNARSFRKNPGTKRGKASS